MPDEFRRLTFSQAELKEALEAPPTAAAKKISSGDITGVRSVRTGNDFSFEIMVFDFSKQKERLIEIDEAAAMEALAEHCRGNDVPLPRDSRKALRVVDQKLCLDIFMGQATEVSQ
jgi:hypothetical protein